VVMELASDTTVKAAQLPRALSARQIVIEPVGADASALFTDAPALNSTHR
jgi:hypothetical protein